MAGYSGAETFVAVTGISSHSEIEPWAVQEVLSTFGSSGRFCVAWFCGRRIRWILMDFVGIHLGAVVILATGFVTSPLLEKSLF